MFRHYNLLFHKKLQKILPPIFLMWLLMQYLTCHSHVENNSKHAIGIQEKRLHPVQLLLSNVTQFLLKWDSAPKRPFSKQIFWKLNNILQSICCKGTWKIIRGQIREVLSKEPPILKRHVPLVLDSFMIPQGLIETKDH